MAPACTPAELDCPVTVCQWKRCVRKWYETNVTRALLEKSRFWSCVRRVHQKLLDAACPACWCCAVETTSCLTPQYHSTTCVNTLKLLVSAHSSTLSPCPLAIEALYLEVPLVIRKRTNPVAHVHPELGPGFGAWSTGFRVSDFGFRRSFAGVKLLPASSLCSRVWGLWSEVNELNSASIRSFRCPVFVVHFEQFT